MKQVRRPGADSARGVPAGSAFLGTLALGGFWMLIELGQILTAQPVVDLPTELGRFLGYLPWQLAIFSCIGVPLAVLARSKRIGPSAVQWLRFGAALFAFLGTVAALGEYRVTRSPGAAVATLGVVAAAIALGLVLPAAAARVLPGRMRGAWPTAFVIGMSLVAVPAVSRASASLRLAGLGRLSWSSLVEPGHWLLGILAGAAVFAFRIRSRWSWVAAVLLMLAIGAQVASREPIGTASSGEGPDVIVIMIDTLRADAIGRVEPGGEGVGSSLTPHLDAIGQEGIVFERAYSAANRTGQSMPALMTSLSAAVVGESLSTDAVTLAEHLRQGGYATYGISTNPYISTLRGYEQGFDAFQDPTVAPDYLVMDPMKVLGQAFPGPAYHWGLISAQLYYATASEVRSRAERILGAAPQPVFLYLQTMDLHGPYLPPKRFLPDDYVPADFLSYYDLLGLAGSGALATGQHRSALENARQRYEAELRFTDEEIGRLVEFLRSRGRWDEALVWIVSDHGEAFGEHGWAGHSGHNVFETLLRVPMILKPPRSLGFAPAVVSHPVSTYDVLPTTLALLGVDAAQPVFGAELVDLRARAVRDHSRIIFSDGYVPGGRLVSAIEGQWQLEVFVPRETGAPERVGLYDLSTAVEARSDVAAAHPERVERLEAAIRARLAQEDRLSMRPGRRSQDARMLERLRELGYVE